MNHFEDQEPDEEQIAQIHDLLRDEIRIKPCFDTKDHEEGEED
jgi:hypothetical protein